MTDYQKQTTILLFANSAEEEANNKTFVHSKEVFDTLNTKTQRLAEKTGLRVLLSTEKEQIGTTFGERFANAIQSAFNQGFSQVITIGNDSPDLKSSHLKNALENLILGKATLGPSYDGGTYLIAFQKEQFSKQAFANLPWQTSKVFSSLKAYFEHQQIEVSQLNYLSDIDVYNDLLTFVNRIKNTYQFLRDLITTLIQNAFDLLHITFKPQQYTYNFFNKGSPIRL
ncbi:TIGR04282 family arsenosugar biosynthesis glycosyltransferase [Tenacibaculum holothuriorum]|uniref:TIGR04282 family arsenosugar biosynthesis glycosyltransferase n=1 Tax=Tenacibaculum holothuriorum TaxID=1635173 RepID=UPI000A31E5EC|nr:DUF2064 domain-containing protein [Tenacibaculum holothuriorum]